MASPTVQNPPAQPQTAESKSSKKKKAKAAAAVAAERVDSPAPVGTPEQAGSVADNNDTSEHPYIRDLKKYATTHSSSSISGSIAVANSAG